METNIEQSFYTLEKLRKILLTTYKIDSTYNFDGYKFFEIENYRPELIYGNYRVDTKKVNINQAIQFYNDKDKIGSKWPFKKELEIYDYYLNGILDSKITNKFGDNILTLISYQKSDIILIIYNLNIKKYSKIIIKNIKKFCRFISFYSTEFSLLYNIKENPERYYTNIFNSRNLRQMASKLIKINNDLKIENENFKYVHDKLRYTRINNLEKLLS